MEGKYIVLKIEKIYFGMHVYHSTLLKALWCRGFKACKASGLQNISSVSLMPSSSSLQQQHHHRDFGVPFANLLDAYMHNKSWESFSPSPHRRLDRHFDRGLKISFGGGDRGQRTNSDRGGGDCVGGSQGAYCWPLHERAWKRSHYT